MPVFRSEDQFIHERARYAPDPAPTPRGRGAAANPLHDPAAPPHRRTHCRTAALRHSLPDGRAAALTAGLSRPVPVLPDRSMARRGPCDLC